MSIEGNGINAIDFYNSSVLSDLRVFEKGINQKLLKVRTEKKCWIVIGVLSALIFVLIVTLGVVNVLVFFPSLNSLLRNVPLVTVASLAAFCFLIDLLLLLKCNERLHLFCQFQTEAKNIERESRVFLEKVWSEKISLEEKNKKDSEEAFLASIESKKAEGAFLKEAHKVEQLDAWIVDNFRHASFIKEEFRELALDAPTLSRWLFPATMAKTISTEGVLWPFEAKVEALYEHNVGAGAYCRSQRELFFILLGFFSRNEFESINDIYQGEWRNSEQIDSHFYNRVYARCIKVHPKIVAAEAAYFFWIKQSFPYLGKITCSIFSSSLYQSTFFSCVTDFVKNPLYGGRDRVFYWIEKLSGWIPACLSVLQTDPLTKGILSCPEKVDWNWEFFCKKVSEFCREAVFYGRAFGDAQSLLDFVENGQHSSKFQEERLSFIYEESAHDFFELPNSLWDIGKLCESDSELMSKVEEGLDSLYDSGYVGNSPVEEMKEFERMILGVKRKRV
ncbi:hypothetical protein [Chlamydiifrater phoenicopteri]|uniref:hypothetical protein n=1 Tax=Chlamydiifrater phoenicopteri TaxID=2681469 RepID=UPI001BCC6B6B|nr:hypothetical protein [Chlamydiifrater phoenicopteri]